MANVMITGASGMIGQSVAEKLIDKRHNIFAVDSDYSGRADDKYYKFRPCDPTDEEAMTDELINNRIDTLIHIAFTVDNDLDPIVTESDMRQSRACDKFIYSAADKAGVKNFILVSTTQVYGIQKGRDPIRESAAEKGSSNYIDMKLMSEKLLLKAFKKSDSVAVIARLAPIYTADFTDNLRSRVVDDKNGEAYMYKDGSYGYSFCCLYNFLDFVSGIVSIPQGRYEGLYNICDKNQITAKEILEYEKARGRISAVVQRNVPRSVSYNKAKGRTDYRFFDPDATFANWNVDNTKAQRISTFRWDLRNTK